MDVSVIGGAGHVGLSMGLVSVRAGHTTRLIDTDTDKLDQISTGTVPFKEKRADAILQMGLEEGLIQTSPDIAEIANSDVVIVTVGTPIDEHNNPNMENLFSLVDGMKSHLDEETLVILRSTVYPGTTSIIRGELQRSGLTAEEDFLISYAPERIVQHNAIEGMIDLPQ